MRRTKNHTSYGKRRITFGHNTLGILIALILLCAALSVASPVFLSVANFWNIFQQVSINFVVAIGMAFVIVSGGIDLSIGSSIAIVGLVMAMMMKSDQPVWLAIAAGLALSAVIGFTNGAMIAYLGLPPFIATLGMMYIGRGLAYTISGGQPVYAMPPAFVMISDRIAGIPLWSLLIMIAVFTIGWYILRYTRVGRSVFAIGGNEQCAKLSGINLNSVKCFVYTVSGLCCGVAAIVLTSRLDSALPTSAEGQEMNAIAAVVIGGTSMKGGEGSLLGTVIGVLIIGVIANGLNLLGVPQGWQRVIKGLIIVIAVVIDVMRRRQSEMG
ncbi:MAG: ABC transporter permease [Clostridia bacterium]|nr:ABC transporter permease [Clostridia bacterium]